MDEPLAIWSCQTAAYIYFFILLVISQIGSFQRLKREIINYAHSCLTKKNLDARYSTHRNPKQKWFWILQVPFETLIQFIVYVDKYLVGTKGTLWTNF